MINASIYIYYSEFILLLRDADSVSYKLRGRMSDTSELRLDVELNNKYTMKERGWQNFFKRNQQTL